jgi:putative ABC transport system permease protein
MFAAVAGAVAAGTWFVSSDALQRAQYKPSLMPNQVAVEVSDDAQATNLAKQLRTVLPASDYFTTHAADMLAGSTATGEVEVLANTVVPCPAGVGGSGLVSGQLVPCGTNYSAFTFVGAPIGDGAMLTKVTGISDPAATRALAQGGVVVFDPALLHDGKVTFRLLREGDAAGAAQADQSGPASVELPGMYAAVHGGPTPGYVISPAAAKQLGINGGRECLVFDLSRHISGGELQRANKLLAGAGIADSSLFVENGYQGNLGAINLIVLAAAVLVAIGAAAIATGLAVADGQPDLETLSAVGGSPATRRLLAGSTALVITGLGALVGVPVGFAIVGGLIQLKSLGLYVGAYVGPGSSMPFVVPWLNVVVAAVGVPLVTAVGAMLLTRSEIRLSRRIT